MIKRKSWAMTYELIINDNTNLIGNKFEYQNI